MVILTELKTQGTPFAHLLPFILPLVPPVDRAQQKVSWHGGLGNILIVRLPAPES